MSGYQYVVLRCVPRVEREEFVNVGVVLYSHALDFLGSASRVDDDRLRALDAEVDVDGVRRALRGVEEVCRGRDDWTWPWARAPRRTAPGRRPTR